jgi:5'-nucleotidase
MSVITKGAQMPPVLNAVGVQAACFGVRGPASATYPQRATLRAGALRVRVSQNHEFDHGLPRAEELCSQCAFPWLMSNCRIKATGNTLGGGETTVLLMHNGVKVGLMGLIEKEWLVTLSTIDESELEWDDFVETGRCEEERPLPEHQHSTTARTCARSSRLDLI